MLDHLRCVPTLLVSLILGIICTLISVALGVWWAGSARTAGLTPAWVNGLQVTIDDRMLVSRFWLRASTPLERVFATNANVPPWSFARSAPEFVRAKAGFGTCEELAYGWPFRAARGLKLAGEQPEAIRGIRLPSRIVSEGKYRFSISRVLPTTPIWLGLGGNVVLYSLVSAGAIGGLRQVRRHRRLRAHCCATCGYDLRGTPRTSPCPECGDR